MRKVIRFGSLVLIAVLVVPVATTHAVTLPIPGMSLWLDAADLSTFPGIGPGGGVNNWTDKSVNAYNFTNGGAVSTKPFRVANSIPGKPDVVHFDGGDLLSMSGSPFSGGVHTIFAVVNAGKPAAEQDILDTGPTGLSRHTLYVISTGIHIFRGGGGGDLGNGNYNANDTFVMTSVWNGASSLISINGANTTTGTVGTNATAPSDTTLGDSDPITGNTSFFTGDIAELLIYNSALSTSDQQANEQYLIDKWLPEPSSASAVLLIGAAALRRSRKLGRTS